MDAIIAGGGIGGLTAAHALARAGWRVRLYEQAERLAPVGAALSLWANALAALDAIGLEQVAAMGTPIERIQARALDGRLLSEIPVGTLARRRGGRHRLVRRARLQRWLADRLDPEVITLGRRVERFGQDATGVTVTLDDGQEVRGAILVGADGLHSTVRRGLWGDEPLRFGGQEGWLGLSPSDEPRLEPATGSETWGVRRRAGMFPLAGGGVYWYVLRNRSDAPPPGAQPATRAEVAPLVADFHAPVPSVVAATPDGAIVRLGIFDRPPRTPWGRGRVTLLGDAAHPMTPNLGQGGCQAIEDAVVLGRLLTGTTSPAGALRSYEQARGGRTARMVRDSRIAGRIAQPGGRIAAALRDLYLRLAPAALFERQYGGYFDFHGRRSTAGHGTGDR